MPTEKEPEQAAAFRLPDEGQRLRLMESVVIHANAAVAITEADPIEPPGPRIVYVNEAFCRITGYRPEEVLGRSLWLLEGPRTDSARCAGIRQELAAGRAVQTEVIHYRRDGSSYWTEIGIAPILSGSATPAYLVSAMRDITERHAAEQALRRAESRNRALLSALPDLMLRIGRDGTYLDYKPARGFPTVVPPSEFLGRRLSEVTPEIAARGMECIQAALETGEIQELEYQLDVGGEMRSYEARLVAAGEDEVLSVVRDITDRKRSEEAVRHVTETLRAILLASPAAIWALDNDGRVLFWNPAAERIFGWTEQEVLGRRTPIVPDEQQPDLEYLLERYRRGEMVCAQERRRRRKDGSPVDMTFWTAPLRNAAGEVAGHVGVVLDVTETKRLEEQFREAQKMEVVGRLAGGIAHDFNNLLTIITGYSQSLLDDIGLSGAHRNAVEEMARAADRASSLTAQLLSFSRRQVTQPKILDLNIIISDMGRMMRRLIGEDVRLRTHLTGGLGGVRADRGQIEQVLMNLVINARDAMPQGGAITIESSAVELAAGNEAVLPPGSYVQVSIRDTGHGMTEEIRRHVFEPFFSTKEVGKGTGLGLFTVYGIVKQSGGGVVVSSNLGEGSIFRVYLPRVHEPAEMPEAAGAVRCPPPGHETVLLVEDEGPVRELIRAILTQQGYIVLEAEDGAAALRVAGEYTGGIDLLLTDVVMPETTGGELAVCLTAQRPGLKVLYISGYTDDAIVHRGVSHLETAFLQKPFAPATLIRKIREVLDGTIQGEAGA